MSVLVVTFSGDNDGITLVSRELEKLGHEAIRLDTDGYPQELQLSTRYGDRRRILKLNGRSHDLAECSAVWYRRFRAGDRLPPKLLGDHLDSAYRESRQTLWGSIAALPCPQVDRLAAVRQADFKELQTEWALQAGLDMPRTLFSNDPAEVGSFYAELEGRMIAKMQTTVAMVRDGKRQVVYTSPVKDLAGIEGLKYGPMVFQELVEKQLDVRVIVVGDELFGAAVDPGGELDWRKEGSALHVAWRPWEVPSSLAGPLRALMRRMELQYGAVDFMVAGDRCLFLEVNAVGEWLWLEQQAGLPIAAALARLLGGSSPG